MNAREDAVWVADTIQQQKAEIERLQGALVQITDETVTDMGELRNIAREVLGWPARDYQQNVPSGNKDPQAR